MNFDLEAICGSSLAGDTDLLFYGLLWVTGAFTKSWAANRPGGGRAWDLSLLVLLKRDWQHVAQAAGGTETQLGARVVLAFERWGLSAEGILHRASVSYADELRPLEAA